MLKQSISPSAGNLNKENSVVDNQQEYQKSVAEEGHFEAPPDYYVDINDFWVKNVILPDPLNFREIKLAHFDNKGNIEIIRNN